jgi:hypothetical protein
MKVFPCNCCLWKKIELRVPGLINLQKFALCGNKTRIKSLNWYNCGPSRTPSKNTTVHLNETKPASVTILSTVATTSVWILWLDSWIVVLRFYLLLYRSVKPKFADHCSSQQRAIIVILQWTGMPFFSLRMPSMWIELTFQKLTFKGPVESWPIDSSHWM